jgi:RNA polymerase sigma-70 factor (ECF subfamily)
MVEVRGDEMLSDEELLARVGDGDRRAFTFLMRRHGRQVRGLALAFFGRAADADDIAQDVFTMLWRRPGAWKPGAAQFATWLYKVTANRCLDEVRRQRIRAWLPFEFVPDPVDETPSADQTVVGRQETARIRSMIRTLPEKQRLALLLAAQDEKSNAEIAAILGVSEGAAEQLLVRARRRLRTMMSDKEDAL